MNWKNVFAFCAVAGGLALAAGGCSGSGGKTAPDAVFAECLKEKGFKMYGSFQCPHCLEQKQMFSSTAWKSMPYVECGKMGEPSEECKAAGIEKYPTWVYPDGSKVVKVHKLRELSEASSCPLPAE